MDTFFDVDGKHGWAKQMPTSALSISGLIKATDT
jgi:hypothetical protein